MLSKLTRYYQQRAYLGKSTLAATLMLPAELVALLNRYRKEGHQINGYRRYDLPLLASYSRSGTNWTRFIVESISGKPTPGQVRLFYTTDFVFDRAHQAYPVIHNYKRVILMLRDYRECLLRHNEALWQKLGDVTAFLEDQSVHQTPDWYIKNVQAFDEFDGEKLVLHYEDIQSNPDEPIRELASFLNLDISRTNEFLANIERAYTNSVASYRSGGHASETSKATDKAKAQDFRHHAKKHLSSEQQLEFDHYYQRNYPVLWEKYLIRYGLTERVA